MMPFRGGLKRTTQGRRGVCISQTRSNGETENLAAELKNPAGSIEETQRLNFANGREHVTGCNLLNWHITNEGEHRSF